MPDTTRRAAVKVKAMDTVSHWFFEDAPVLAAHKQRMEAGLHQIAEGGGQRIVGPIVWHEPEPLAFEKGTDETRPPRPLWMLPAGTEPELYTLRCEAEVTDA